MNRSISTTASVLITAAVIEIAATIQNIGGDCFVDKSLSSTYDLSMNVKLTPELEGIIQEKVNSGLYSDQSEVVREGLRLLLERDSEHVDSREAWKRSLAIGLEEANSGQLLPGDEVLANFRADLESRL